MKILDSFSVQYHEYFILSQTNFETLMAFGKIDIFPLR